MAEKDIIKKYGEVIMDASLLLDEPRHVIPFSPSLDIGLNGGIPEGSWVVISGQPKIGKTTSILQFCATAQLPEHGARQIVYCDIEGRLKHMNLNGVHGLDISKIKVIKSTKEKILSAEDNVNILIDYIKSTPGGVFVLDSASALCSSKEMTEEVTGQTRALGPKILASFCRQMGTIVPIQKSIVIIVQHLIANTSGYGSPYVEDGGQKTKYQADVRLRAKGQKEWKSKETRIGQIVEWEVVTSALGAPGAKVESYIRYGYGIDDIWESLTMACDIGVIEAKGAWYNVNCLDEPQKFQGMENLYNFYSSNPDIYKELLIKIKESL